MAKLFLPLLLCFALVIAIQNANAEDHDQEVNRIPVLMYPFYCLIVIPISSLINWVMCLGS